MIPALLYLAALLMAILIFMIGWLSLLSIGVYRQAKRDKKKLNELKDKQW